MRPPVSTDTENRSQATCELPANQSSRRAPRTSAVLAPTEEGDSRHDDASTPVRGTEKRTCTRSPHACTATKFVSPTTGGTKSGLASSVTREDAHPATTRSRRGLSPQIERSLSEELDRCCVDLCRFTGGTAPMNEVPGTRGHEIFLGSVPLSSTRWKDLTALPRGQISTGVQLISHKVKHDCYVVSGCEPCIFQMENPPV